MVAEELALDDLLPDVMSILTTLNGSGSPCRRLPKQLLSF